MQEKDWSELVSRILDVARGHTDPMVTPLAGDASSRSYFRARTSVGSTVVVMMMADDPLKSDEVVDGERPDTIPFLDVGEYLGRGGIPVPDVLYRNLDSNIIVLEDLGDSTVERALAEGGDKASLYGEAVDVMVAMEAWAESTPDSNCIAFKRRFGEGLLRWELEHFHEWLLVEWTGYTPTAGECDALNEFYDHVVEILVGLPTGFVHRDFQSRNLMIRDGRMRLIDFQDALQGPYLYDLVALLRDSYVAFDRSEVVGIHRAFLAARQKKGLWVPDEDDLMDAFQAQALQRKLKDAGRFVYIDRMKKNPKFLGNIPRSLAYAREALEHFPHFSDAREIFARYLPEHFG